MTNVLKKQRHIRIVAVQTLFQLMDSPDDLSTDEALDYALANGLFPEEGYDEVANDYLHQLVEGVLTHSNELDKVIEEHLSNWNLNRLLKIDRTILRLAIYEMNYVDDRLVPKKVAVDEAIELAKGFSDDKSRRFVSGVLLALLNEETVVGDTEEQDNPIQ